MKLKGLIKRGIEYLRNTDVDLRIRLLFILQYTTLLAVLIGSVAMLSFATSPSMLIPNFVLFIVSLFGLYLSHIKKMYELTANIIIIVCAYVAIPTMYFTAGGYMSGMPIWCLFTVVFVCLMSKKGPARVIHPLLTIIIDAACMFVSYIHPEYVMPLADESASFYDMFQSYIIVSLMICICICIYLMTYDKQRVRLEEQQEELNKLINTDALTGVKNRHAYYNDIERYKDVAPVKNLVLVILDVNGLKRVNDTKGHAEGDALIVAASNMISNVFEGYGTLYRVGGDEFMAILNCDDDKAYELESKLDCLRQDADKTCGADVSVAAGFAVWNQNRSLNYFELEKLADTKMYQNKSAYYIKTGKDRRK